MTIQASDSFLFKGERYALFDVSNNQTLSCKLCAGIPDNTIACTSAMRAYQESLPHDERGIIIWDGALSSCANAVNALESSCPELPRGTYSKDTLVNRLSNATCALCGNVINSS